jgi:hypothetical protein
LIFDNAREALFLDKDVRSAPAVEDWIPYYRGAPTQRHRNAKGTLSTLNGSIRRRQLWLLFPYLAAAREHVGGSASPDQRCVSAQG